MRASDVRALREFVRDYPECEPLLVYRGERRLEVGGIRCMPVADFLGMLDPA